MEPELIRITISNLVWRLWHYGHFIHDFIMPVLLYINTVNKNVKGIYVINKGYEHQYKMYKSN